MPEGLKSRDGKIGRKIVHRLQKKILATFEANQQFGKQDYPLDY